MTTLATPPPEGWTTRFAPSPTGSLHVGNLRTALLNYLTARASGGRFLLRIEDTDQARSSVENEVRLTATLLAYGLEPDAPPVRQSARLSHYQALAEDLMAKGLAYPCFCTDEDLEAHRNECRLTGAPPRYAGTCTGLSDEERQLRGDCGDYTVRFRVDREEPLVFEDLLKGQVTVPADAFGDFVILRSDGWPSYNFAVVADDHAMGVNLVLRGEDHLTNTARQILLYQALGYEAPAFAHHGLLLNEARKKLSKRDGAVTARQFLDEGHFPQAVAGYLASLGGALEPAVYEDLEAMALAFDPARIGHTGVVFQHGEVARLNTEHLRGLPAETVLLRMEDAGFLDAAWAALPRPRRVALVDLARRNAETLADLPSLLALFYKPEVAYSAQAADALATGEGVAVFEAMLGLIKDHGWAEDAPPPDPAQWAGEGKDVGALVMAAGKKAGAKGKALWMPLRLALTGAVQGPEVKDLLAALPVGVIINRLEHAKRLARVCER